MGRPGHYLFQRNGGDTWWFQFIYPKDVAPAVKAAGYPTRIAKSLKTTDRLEAEGLCARHIGGHKLLVAAHRAINKGNALQTNMGRRQLEPGDHPQPDGSVHQATDEMVFVLRDGRVVDSYANTLPNGMSRNRTTLDFSNVGIDLKQIEPMLELFAQNEQYHLVTRDGTTKPKRTIEDMDLKAILNWKEIHHVKDKPYEDAERVVKLFHATCPGKTLFTADIADGRALVAAMYAKGNKWASVDKRIGVLRTILRLAAKDEKNFPFIKKNGFTDITPKVKGHVTKKQQFEDHEMKLLNSFLFELNDEAQLLWRICAATGFRRSEAHSIKYEVEREGYRCFHVGVDGKTEGSDRIIPIPNCLMEYLPANITSTLFPSGQTEIRIGARIRDWLQRHGFTGRYKTLHSLRHRATNRIMSAHIKWQYAYLGHKEKLAEVHMLYGGDTVTDALFKTGELIGLGA